MKKLLFTAILLSYKLNGMSPSVMEREYKKLVNEYTNNNKCVLEEFGYLIKAIKKGYFNDDLDSSDIQQIYNALEYATIHHSKVLNRENNGAPAAFICHPMRIARTIMEAFPSCDAKVIVTTLLLDNRKNVALNFDEIQNKFGRDIKNWLQQVNECKTQNAEERIQHQIAQASSRSLEVCILVLAKECYTCKQLHDNPAKGWSQEKRIQYYKWVQTLSQNLDYGYSLKNKLNDELNNYLKEEQKRIR